MKYWIGIVLLGILGFSACKSEPQTAEEKQAAMIEKMKKEGGLTMKPVQQEAQKPLSDLGNSNWTVIQLTYEGEDFPLSNEKSQPIRISGWSISGATCPRFGGAFDVPAEGQFEAKAIRSPNTGNCDPSEAALSRRLRGVIESATAYELLLEGQQLKITGEKGMVLCSANL